MGSPRESLSVLMPVWPPPLDNARGVLRRADTEMERETVRLLFSRLEVMVELAVPKRAGREPHGVPY